MLLSELCVLLLILLDKNPDVVEASKKETVGLNRNKKLSSLFKRTTRNSFTNLHNFERRLADLEEMGMKFSKLNFWYKFK